MESSPNNGHCLDVNGVRLHYLDWGGSGETLVFLAGFGCNAHIFGSLAPRFCDGFRVLALTRRGHGQSEHPETGYDIDTLTQDIHQFLQALSIEKVILVGHSMANIELTHFAALHPEMVSRLVFLDAAYNRSNDAYKYMNSVNPLRQFKAPGKQDAYPTPKEYFAAEKYAAPALAHVWSDSMDRQAQYEIMQNAAGNFVDRMSDSIAAAITGTLNSYLLEETQIRAPVQSFFAINNERYYLADWMTEAQKQQVLDFFQNVNNPWVQENIERFKKNVPQAHIVILPEGHHYCFIKEEQRIYEEMRRFLIT